MTTFIIIVLFGVLVYYRHLYKQEQAKTQSLVARNIALRQDIQVVAKRPGASWPEGGCR